MEHFDDDRGAPDEQDQALVPASPVQNQIARADLMGTSLATNNAATDALIAKERASIEARWVMAMRRPRNIDDVRQKVIAECRRPGFAQVALYHRPAGNVKDEKTGKWVPNIIEGLSIRFAEVAVRCMTNIDVDVQTIFDGDRDRVVRVIVTDFESNITWRKDVTVKKTVERKQLKRGQRPLGERVNSYGDRVFIVEATDDEVNVKEAAMVSKASRTGILRCVPGHIQDEAKKICRQVAADKTAKDPDAERIKVQDAFATLGVMPSQLSDYIGKPFAQTLPGEIDSLRNLYTAIRDGEITWSEAYTEATDGRDVKKPAPAIVPTEAAPSSTPASEPEKSKSGTSKLKNAIAPKAETAKLGPDGEKYACTDCGVPLSSHGRCDACANS